MSALREKFASRLCVFLPLSGRLSWNHEPFFCWKRFSRIFCFLGEDLLRVAGWVKVLMTLLVQHPRNHHKITSALVICSTPIIPPTPPTPSTAPPKWQNRSEREATQNDLLHQPPTMNLGGNYWKQIFSLLSLRLFVVICRCGNSLFLFDAEGRQTSLKGNCIIQPAFSYSCVPVDMA